MGCWVNTQGQMVFCQGYVLRIKMTADCTQHRQPGHGAWKPNMLLTRLRLIAHDMDEFFGDTGSIRCRKVLVLFSLLRGFKFPHVAPTNLTSSVFQDW